MTNDSLPAPIVYKWPNTAIDDRAFDMAVAELGLDVTISEIANRAQVIKEQLRREESQ